MRVCENCGAQVGEQSKFCENCGAKLKTVCINCGEELSGSGKFCPNCGTPVAGQSAPVNIPVAPAPKNDGLFDFSAEEAAFDDQLQAQAEYDKKIARARAFVIRGRYEEARALYEELFDLDPSDMNGYMGLVRIETKNYTVYEGENIDAAIKVAKDISGVEDIAQFEAGYAAYEKKRSEYFAEKSAEQERLKKKEKERLEKERLKAEEDARLAKETEEKRKAEEKRLAEEAEKARKAEEEAKARADLENFTIEKQILKKYVGNAKIVVIPDGVEKIGKSAFIKNKTVESVVIPDSVTEIVDFAFNGCKNLKNVTFGKGLKLIGQYVFKACENLQEAILPDGLSLLWAGAFKDCSSLAKVKLGNCLQQVVWDTFKGCRSLKSVEIPDSVSEIQCSAFAKCNNLTEIVVSKNHKTYKTVDGNIYTKDGKTLVRCAGAKKSVTIPSTVTAIGAEAFCGCECLTSITIPYSVTHIGSHAFTDCINLSGVKFICTSGWQLFYAHTKRLLGTIEQSTLQVDSIAATCLKTTYDFYLWVRK